jgi:hypothetical protein
MQRIDLNVILNYKNKQIYSLRCEKFKNGFYFIIFNCLENDCKKCIISIIDLNLKISKSKTLENVWYQSINKINDTILLKLFGYKTFLCDNDLNSTELKLMQNESSYNVLGMSSDSEVLFFKNSNYEIFMYDLKENKCEQMLFSNFDLNKQIICQIECKKFKYYISAFDRQTKEYSLFIFENDSMNLKLKKSISINYKFSFLFDSKNNLVLLMSQKLFGKNKLNYKIYYYDLNGNLLNEVNEINLLDNENLYHFIDENLNKLLFFTSHFIKNNFNNIYA